MLHVEDGGSFSTDMELNPEKVNKVGARWDENWRNDGVGS